jgi:serine/threonine-protein kinase
MLQQLFDGALDVAEPQRVAWLDAQTNDPQIRAEVRTLLDRHAAAGPSTSDYQLGAGRLAAVAADGAAVLGTWRLLTVAGQGGMGSVYLAQRTFKDGAQRAALKISHALLPDAESARRLRAERAVLASVDHPGIARLIDAGETNEGRPWFAMEWVDGEPLLPAFRQRRMGTRDRISVFRRICAAISHAHQRLVLHRDIKSGNVLLDRAGAPRIVDFGIAKLLETGGVDSTAASERFFTAKSAAPEQVAGGLPTTAIDVYGVGALLYEALAGRPPLDLDDARSPADIARIVQVELPLAPSRAVANAVTDGDTKARAAIVEHALACGVRDPQALARALSGDLDRIVLQCLRKDPMERYRSIDDLDADLQRWLDGLPVRAAGQSFFYQARKLAWRHRLPLAAGVVTFAALSILSATLAWQGTELRAERDRARLEQQRSETERGRADATTEFLVDAFQRADPRRAGSPTVSRREIVDSALQRLEAGFMNDPGIVGRLAVALADLAQATGHRDAVARAIELYGRVALSEGPPSARDQTELALLTGRAAANRGAMNERRALLQIANTAHAELAESDPELDYRLGIQVAQFAFDVGDRATALERFMALRDSIPAGSRQPDRSLRLEIRIATALRTLGRSSDSVAVLERALSGAASHNGALPSTRVDAMLGLAAGFRELDRHADSLRLAREALVEVTGMFGPESANVASTRSAVAAALDALGRHAEAEPEHLEVLAIYTAQRGPDDPNTLMASYNLLRARILAHGVNPERAAEAEALASRAETRWGRGHPNAQVMALLAARTMHDLGSDRAARLRYSAIVRQAAATGRADLSAARATLGIALIDAKRDGRDVDKAALLAALNKLASAPETSDPLLTAGRALGRTLLHQELASHGN